MNPVLRVPPAAPADAVSHFAAQFAFYTDVSDVHAALGLPDPGFVLVDSRNATAWRQGRIPGALHLPAVAEELDVSVPVVTYCWGPACNGAARAALALSRLGYRVKEMLGGIEYWVREGLPVEADGGPVSRPPDPTVA